MEQLLLPFNKSKKDHYNSIAKINIPRHIIIKIIEAGIQAPSADNMQPWRFMLLANGLELWINEKSKGHFFDHKDIATYYSCGAVLENIVSYSKFLNLEATVNFNKSGSNKIAEIFFREKSNYQEDNLSKAIFQRCTDRNLFKFKEKIPQTVINNLKAIFQTTTAYQLYDYGEPKMKQEMTEIITAVDAIRFSHEKIHHDFYEILRFGKTASILKDGLAENTLGVESIFVPPLKLLKSWSITKTLNYFGLHHLMAFRSTWLPMKSSSNIMAITHSGPANYIEFGKVMQSFWLNATLAGLSVQPLGAMPLLLSRIELSNGLGLNQKQINKLISLKNRFCQITSNFNKDTDQMVMLFRLGYSKKTPYRSFRKSVEFFLI